VLSNCIDERPEPTEVIASCESVCWLTFESTLSEAMVSLPFGTEVAASRIVPSGESARARPVGAPLATFEPDGEVVSGE